MRTIHKISLSEAKEIIRKHYNLDKTAEIDIEDVTKITKPYETYPYTATFLWKYEPELMQPRYTTTSTI